MAQAMKGRRQKTKSRNCYYGPGCSCGTYMMEVTETPTII